MISKFKNKYIKKLPNKKPVSEDYYRRKIGVEEETLPTDSNILKASLNKIFEHSADFRTRTIGLPSGQTVYLYYIEGLNDKERLEANVIRPLVHLTEQENKEVIDSVDEVIYGINYIEPKSWKELIDYCLSGYIICHIENRLPVVLSLQKVEKRSLSEPTTEQQVYGPKIGFVEDSRTNVVLLRKYIKDPRLCVKEYQVGSMSATSVAVVYLDEYVDEELLNKIDEKIKGYQNDQLFVSNTLTLSIVERPLSLFPQVQKSERPDQAAFALGQGKVIIIVDNSTFCHIVPTTLFSFYEKSDDNDIGSVWNLTFLRLLRFISLIVATTFPALYVSLVAFHPEMIPTTLALTMAESRNNIPFPAAVEAVMMMFALDVLVEASIRLPHFIGQTIGIVGGLVIGQAAVEAGIISSTMVIVIAFTAIAAFTSPSWEMTGSWRIVRYLLLFFASIFGLYGLTIGICLLLMHLCALTSFNKPYFSPLTPFNPKELLDGVLRLKTQSNKKKGEQIR